jgi:hypothetical protein
VCVRACVRVCVGGGEIGYRTGKEYYTNMCITLKVLFIKVYSSS